MNEYCVYVHKRGGKMNTHIQRYYYHLKSKRNNYKTFILILSLVILSIGLCIYKNTKPTENFYYKIVKGIDVNILIVGDSIGKGSGASSLDKNWVSLLSDMLYKEYGVNCKITNISMGGNTSYAGYVRTMELNDNIDYDLAILCYGQNDKNEDFTLYYESMIRAIQHKYKRCEIISILESSQRKYTAKTQQIQQLDNYYDIPIADTIAYFSESGINYNILSDDGIHPSDKGHEFYAKTIKDVISNKTKGKIVKVKRSLPPYNQNVVKFDTFKYIGVSEFNRVNDTTLEFETEGLSGIMGIDYTFESGNNSVDIYSNNQAVATKTLLFDYNFSQRHIIIIKKDCRLSGVIRLTFGSATQTDGFNGIVFSNIGN